MAYYAYQIYIDKNIAEFVTSVSCMRPASGDGNVTSFADGEKVFSNGVVATNGMSQQTNMLILTHLNP